VRYGSKGETEFGIGTIAPGEKPFHPFQVDTADKQVLVNERTEVHTGEQDYVGAFEVKGSGQALFLTLSVDGAPSVSARVVTQAAGDGLIDAYVRTPGPARLAAGALLDEVVPAGQLFRRFVNVPAGRYYLLLDHSERIGQGVAVGTAPDQAAKVDYLLLVGDAP
jgi:hypothetical protein